MSRDACFFSSPLSYCSLMYVDVKIIRYGRTSFHQESREIICGKSHSPNSPSLREQQRKFVCRPKCPPLSAPSGQSFGILTYVLVSLRIWLSLSTVHTDIDKYLSFIYNVNEAYLLYMICMYVCMYIQMYIHMDTYGNTAGDCIT